jgi:hypothetical protein
MHLPQARSLAPSRSICALTGVLPQMSQDNSVITFYYSIAIKIPVVLCYLMIIPLLIVVLSIVIFYAILQLDISGIYKFLLVALEMIAVSQIFIKKYNLPSEMGFVLIKSKKGIEIIDKLSKNIKAFHFMTDVGNVLAYGLSSRMFIKNGTIPSLVIGLILLAILAFFVGPTAFSFLVQVIEIGTIDKSVSTISDGADYGFALISLILLFGGLFLFILFGIMFYGGIVLAALIQSTFFGADTISKISPGGTFLLPGINLPLFEGILALVVVLIVHEGAHAILTRIAKVPLLSSGIVLFGIIPIGAFVEPDEKKLGKIEPTKQTRVMIAGPTSNLITSVGFFVLFILSVIIINGSGLTDGIYANIAKFIYVTLGLTFALNFIVGVVNLLPLPLFDGFRVVDINIKNKLFVKILMYITLFFFAVNFLPWFFR